MNKHMEMKIEAMEKIIEVLEDGFDDYYCDLHNEVFNTDYYIVGTYDAKNALREYDVFNAIELVQEYEDTQFGERHTDVSNPEKLVNMLFYVIGDEVIAEMMDIPAFDDNRNNCADEETNRVIIDALRVKLEGMK